MVKRFFGTFGGAPRKARTRNLLLGGAAVLLCTVGAVALTRHKPKAIPSVVGAVPAVNQQLGEKNASSSDYYADLTREQDRNKVADATRTGTTYAGTVGSLDQNGPQTPPPLSHVHKLKKLKTAMHAKHSPPLPPKTAFDQGRYAAYLKAIDAVSGQFAGSTPQTIVVIRPVKKPTLTGNLAAAGDPVMPASIHQSARAMVSPRRKDKILISAGHGVYARTIVGVSSDEPGPIVVEAESGPIAGDRMIGHFSQTGNNVRDRLVVHLSEITLADGTQKSIDALVVAPGTMETTVATSVNEHYVSRIVLPAAAAFVQGLGTAIGQSGSTVVAGPLGGATEFSHVNTAQGVAAGAGSAASTVASLLAAQAPSGPTVKLAADTDVGVLFLQPLKVPTVTGTP